MTTLIDGIPVFDATLLDEECGMFKVSLVDEPAVLSNFLAFKDDKKALMYAVADEEQRRVFGVLMRADFPIYRKDDKMGEYYVIYKADTIRDMAEKYLLESRQNNVNLMHEDGSDVDGVQMVQCFIKDSAKGINPDGFDVADGSLFAEYHVVNDDVWAQIKDGTFRGFSLEGVFGIVPDKEPEKVQEIVDSLGGKFNKEQPINNKKMTKLDKIKEALRQILMECGSVTTDRGVLVWDGDEDLKAGDAVSIEDQDGNKIDVEDGDYITDDKKTIVVADGKVVEIKDPEAEVAPKEGEGEGEGEGGGEKAAEEMSRAQRIAEAFSESYDEKVSKMYDALKAMLGEDAWPWIVEAGDDYCVVDDGNGKLFRYAVSWGEDGAAVLGDAVEVKPAYIPVDAEDPFNEKANEDLRREIEQLKAQPLAKPAHEQVNASAEVKVTGDKKLDRLARLLSAK